MLNNEENPQLEKYDVIIAGAGPAGFTAGLYAVRYRLSALVLGQIPGGTASEAHRICNYPTEKEISGGEIAKKMYETALYHGVSFQPDFVKNLKKHEEGYFIAETSGGREFYGETALIAVGTKRRKLGVPGEDEFYGKGVSYCATCDGMFYKDKTVAVVGGSDAAFTAALYLSEVAEKVYLIYRGDNFKTESIWTQQVKNNSLIEILYSTQITSIEGEEKVSILNLNNAGEEKSVKVQGVFVEIGSDPDVEAFSGLKIALDNKGYINVADDQTTNIEGLWAAGDITNNSNYFKQIITASSEGAVAADSISRYLFSKR